MMTQTANEAVQETIETLLAEGLAEDVVDACNIIEQSLTHEWEKLRLTPNEYALGVLSARTTRRQAIVKSLKRKPR